MEAQRRDACRPAACEIKAGEGVEDDGVGGEGGGCDDDDSDGDAGYCCSSGSRGDTFEMRPFLRFSCTTEDHLTAVGAVVLFSAVTYLEVGPRRLMIMRLIVSNPINR